MIVVNDVIVSEKEMFSRRGHGCTELQDCPAQQL